ncbi:cell division protein FtsQ/DivIB [Gracilimonas amylolytica]|uniref:cell division protein FtsQ/DivIB n=1 Tax=Gracilimonas amylolytica TaxID=1749045 RepID=UPI000CD97EF9|nr:cell division protein FtsQ/DivIB [Gracilimonas amylolytica]
MSKKDSNTTLLPWVTGIMMVIAVAVLAAVYWTRTVTVDELDINALTFTEPEEIEAAASVPFGIQPDSLDIQAVVQRVEELRYVRSVVPYIEPSGDLRLTVSEREPIAMLIDGSQRAYVDAEGVILPILENKTRDVPLLYGYSVHATDTLKDEPFSQVRDFLMKAKVDQFGWATISEVAFDPVDGVVALSHENGVKLLFGRNDFEMKLENWKAFYKQVVRTKGIQSMQQVDLRFSNQVVTREI